MKITIKGLRYEVTHFDLSDEKRTNPPQRHNVKFLELCDKVGGVYLFRVKLTPSAKWSRLINDAGETIRVKDGETLTIREDSMRNLVSRGFLALIRDEPVAMRWDPTKYNPLS